MEQRAQHPPWRAQCARMVEEQIARPSDGRRPVRDDRVLAAMRSLPRHLFVPAEDRAEAYGDRPLLVGCGQTISQPYMVAIMTELLALAPEARALEIGAGTGYQTAVLARLAAKVFSVERVPALAREACRRLAEIGVRNARIRCGDGFEGWPEHAPYDAILLTAAPVALPPRLLDQLRPGGRLVAPIGPAEGAQSLTLVTRRADGARDVEEVMGVRFVPMLPGVAADG